MFVLMYRYRPAAESDETIATSPKKTKPETKSSKSGGRRKTDELWTGETILLRAIQWYAFLWKLLHTIHLSITATVLSVSGKDMCTSTG